MTCIARYRHATLLRCCVCVVHKDAGQAEQEVAYYELRVPGYGIHANRPCTKQIIFSYQLPHLSQRNNSMP